ncbi:zinc ribbon domain-containing protein [Ochrobactrum pseudogrignonense]|uniref:Zinc ribbon domain-containing protein n=1 Tax=Brucella pseudogrignonensis TaxID=419475 RepID=A0A7Y3T2T6_9HYPH|nr:zinc ribbon domain-containing protein [Brucella pseudogrignonensis]NNV19944.1 zinc ribbon domain-containing protein [Brucella pseudogrignonensis]
MALIKCSECGREISDKAAACVGCGAPVQPTSSKADEPVSVKLNSDGSFLGTRSLLVNLAAKAILQNGWKLDGADEKSGIVSFTTGVTWGSWSGVSGTVFIDEIGEHRFNVIGSAKQNVRGAQLFAPNIGNEAQRKANKVIEIMRQLAQ